MIRNIFILALINSLIGSSAIQAQDAVEKKLSEMKLYKNSIGDFEILKEAFYFVSFDSTLQFVSVSDISLWFYKKNLFLEDYDTCNSEEGFKSDANVLKNLPPSHSVTCYTSADEFALEFFSFTLYGWRAHRKFFKEDYNGAITDYKNSLLYPDNPSKSDAKTFYNIGLCYAYLNDMSDACKYMSKSGELGYDDAYTFIKKNCNYPIK